MGTHRLKCVRLTSLTLWLLLATAAAQENYDDMPDVEAVNYQDDNVLDTGPMAAQRGPYLALAKDVFLYKLFQSLHQGNTNSRTKYKPDWATDYQESPQSQYSQHARVPEKDGVVKRITDALRGSETKTGVKKLQRIYRPQRKWKIKKGYQMVCYFKLCAFRSPNSPM